MALRPEVNTTPWGALLLIVGIVLVLLGAAVLPALIYIVAWGLVVLVVLLITYYIGQRLHRWALGRTGGRA